MQLLLENVVLALLTALLGGFLGAAFKLNKDAEVRNRQGDFVALSVLTRIGKLLSSRVPPAYNYTSTNVTKANTRLLVAEINERMTDFHTQLIDAAAKSSPKFRKDLFLIGNRLQYLDPIHIVQLLIANADKEGELPQGGLREYLTGEILENESAAHLEIARFLVFTDKIKKSMNKHHFKVENMDIAFLTRLEESEDNQIRSAVRELVEAVSEVLNIERNNLDVDE